MSTGLTFEERAFLKKVIDQSKRSGIVVDSLGRRMKGKKKEEAEAEVKPRKAKAKATPEQAYKEKIRLKNAKRKKPCRGGCGRLCYHHGRTSGYCRKCSPTILAAMKMHIHGTELCYKKKRCRCVACRAASSKGRIERRNRARERDVSTGGDVSNVSTEANNAT